MKNKWWEDFYDDTFQELMSGHRTEAMLDDLAAFLMKILNLKKGSVLFDQCCGSGEVSHALAKHGVRVIGIDQSKTYIANAKKKKKLPASFYVGDAFTFTPKQQCDAAINWWTSFGLVADDAQNMQMLQRVYDSLKPGGWFALEYANADFDIAHFRKRVSFKMQTPEGVFKSIREYKLDLKRGMRASKWTYQFPDGRTVKKSGETRLYTPKDIQAMLKKCGFSNCQVIAGFNKSRVTKNTPRFICLAQK